MKRLLCIISSLNTGGAETFLMKIYRTFPLEEYQMDFVVSENDGYYTQEVLDRGGRIYFVPTRTKHLVEAFSEIRRIVKENNYEYVLKLGDSPVQTVDLLAAKMGGAKVLALRSCNAITGLSLKRKIIDSVFRPILNRTATVKIAPSDLAAIYTFGQKEFSSGSVQLLNNGVDLQVFTYDPDARRNLRAEFGLQDELLVGHVGRFNQQKNHDFLLDVFAEMQIQNPNAVLMLVGQGELEAAIRQKAQRLGIADKMIMTGVRGDVPKLLSAMDVMVFPSFYEGMPNVIIEAQATGLPCVIASTITRNADITGLVQYLPLEDPQTWAEKACSAVNAPRVDTKQAFVDKQYDIGSTVECFTKLVFGE